jgi:hypothetical protein
VKTGMVLICTLLALPAAAGTLWISHYDGVKSEVARIPEKGAPIRVAQAYPAARAETSSRVAIVAAFEDPMSLRLRVFDKKTGRAVADWPIPLSAEQSIGRNSSDVLLFDDSAYLLVRAATFDPAATVRNELGGIYAVIRIALRDGKSRVVPLDGKFEHAQLLGLNGIPVVADWQHNAISRLSPDGRRMVELSFADGLTDGMSAEKAYIVWSTHFPGAEQVAVEGAGVFRQTKTGNLQRITDANLEPLPEPRASIALGPVNRTQLLLAATSVAGPAIAVIRQTDEARTLTFVDATTLSVLWQRPLDEGAYIWATIAAGPDAIVYVDRFQGKVVRLSRTGTQVLHRLPAESYFTHAHLLSAGSP